MTRTVHLRRRIVAGLFGGLVALAAVACGGSGDETATTTAAEEDGLTETSTGSASLEATVAALVEPGEALCTTRELTEAAASTSSPLHSAAEAYDADLPATDQSEEFMGGIRAARVNCIDEAAELLGPAVREFATAELGVDETAATCIEQAVLGGIHPVQLVALAQALDDSGELPEELTAAAAEQGESCS